MRIHCRSPIGAGQDQSVAPMVFSATSFSRPQEFVEDCAKVGLHHREFLGADRHDFRQVIDDERGWQGMVRGKADLLRVPRHPPLRMSPFWPPRLRDGVGRVAAFAEVRASR